MNTKFLGDFTIKSDAKGKDLFIEGLANAKIVDRGGDLMIPEGAKMDEFQMNPILLFNHDRSYPIGKVLTMKATDGGLYAKAKLSNSKHEKVQYVRDLVEEDILKTFSIGFDPQGQPKEGPNGEKIFDNYNMLELSIVTLPMNQASTFAVVKELSTKGWGKKDYQTVRREVLLSKGAAVAAAVQDSIHTHQQDGANRAELLQQVADAAKVELQDIMNVIAGNVSPVPAEILAAFSSVLGMDETQLAELDQTDAELEQSTAEGEPAEENSPEEEKPEEKVPAEDTPKADKPAADAENPAEDAAPTEEKPEEDKKPAKKEAEEKASSMDDCISERVRHHMNDGKPQDQAVAIAISECQKEKGVSCSVELAAKMIEYAETYAVELEKQAGQDPSQTPSTPVATPTDESNTGNPQYELMKSQIALMGAILTELKSMNLKMDSLCNPSMPVEPAPAQPTQEELPPSADYGKSLQVEQVKKMYDNIDSILKEVGF
jgi:HK97 family phage prohead protease